MNALWGRRERGYSGTRPVTPGRPGQRINWLALSTAVLLLFPIGASGQQISFKGDEYVGGAAFNILLRSPVVSAGWRKPLPRAFLFTTTSVFYEKYLDHAGWQWSDLLQRCAGYLTFELVVEGARHLLGRRH